MRRYAFAFYVIALVLLAIAGVTYLTGDRGLTWIAGLAVLGALGSIWIGIVNQLLINRPTGSGRKR